MLHELTAGENRPAGGAVPAPCGSGACSRRGPRRRGTDHGEDPGRRRWPAQAAGRSRRRCMTGCRRRTAAPPAGSAPADRRSRHRPAAARSDCAPGPMSSGTPGRRPASPAPEPGYTATRPPVQSSLPLPRPDAAEEPPAQYRTSMTNTHHLVTMTRTPGKSDGFDNRRTTRSPSASTQAHGTHKSSWLIQPHRRYRAAVGSVTITKYGPGPDLFQSATADDLLYVRVRLLGMSQRSC